MADISKIQNGEAMTLREQIGLTARLALPAILAQLSSIMMQYITHRWSVVSVQTSRHLSV